jgi:hypothetical protein
MMILASLAAAGLVTSSRQTVDIDPDDPLGAIGIDAKAFDYTGPSMLGAPVPRGPRVSVKGSKYMPHNGTREMERRRKRMLKSQTA